ncbi:MAG: fluoride efflux transporter CrcB [Sphingomonas sp.]|nr:fluoride efflux transporter CrcB [Sphingomonas sp.]
MVNLFLVMAGGALGAGARYLVGHAFAGASYPWGTLAVNIAGALAMGLLAGVVAKGLAGEPARLLLGVGVLGGFTTFSAFSLELVTMAERGAMPSAIGYALASVIGSVVALFIGLGAVRAIA